MAAKRGKQPAPAGETKADAFVRLADARMTKALGAISNIGKLANKNAYDFTKEQAEALASVLADTVGEVEQRFADALAGKRAKGPTGGFSLAATLEGK